MPDPTPTPRPVLLVEDDPGIRALLLAVMSRASIRVECVHDGADAVAALRRDLFSAMLLDLMMPKVNGFEVLREVRSFLPDMLKRTIIITAASDVTLRDFDRSQVAVVLRKPFDVNELLTAVKGCIAEGDAGSRSQGKSDQRLFEN